MTSFARRHFLAGFCACACAPAHAWPVSEGGNPMFRPQQPAPLAPRASAPSAGCTFAPGTLTAADITEVGQVGLGPLAPAFGPITVAERQAVLEIFGLDARLGFYDDASPNAVALPPQPGSHPGGTILLGAALCGRLVDFARHSAVIGVIAHEAGHLLQYRHSADLAPTQVRTLEIQADYLAGWYIQRKNRLGRNVNLDDFSAALGLLGDVQFTSPDHHGTPDQRQTALAVGFDDSWNDRATDVETAYRRGAAHAKSLPPLP